MFAKNRILGVTGSKINTAPRESNNGFMTVPKQVNAGYMSVSGGAEATSKSLGIYWNTNFQYYMTGLLPATPDMTDTSSISLMYRDMYLYDSVAGCAVDIQSTFPFSDWELRGLEDDDLDIFNKALDRLNIQIMLPEISIAILTDGFFAGSLIFDQVKKQFMDILIHDALQCSILPSPFNNIDPLITVHTSGMTQQFLQNRTRYTDAYLNQMPASVISMIKQGTFDLDPLTTLFIGRKKLSDRAYVSYLQRLLPMYLIEKVMFQGTLVEAQRRQRATTHITVGDDLWTPTKDEMLSIAQQFQLSENDPLGAWIVTRNSIQTNDIRPGGDFWKWTDMTDSLRQMKLQALGISDAFLSGDACLTGDTLIPSRNGLRRIDSFGESTNTKWHEMSLRMDSRLGYQNSTHWRYSGIKPTYKVVTASGNEIKATGNHQVLVFTNGEFVWKRTDKLCVGDLLCLSTRTMTSSSNAKLPEKPLPRTRKQRSLVDKNGQKRGISLSSHNYIDHDIKVPRYVNSAFAQWLAMFISEGWAIDKDKATVEGGAKGVGFSNTDKKLINRFAELTKKLFGLNSTITHKDKDTQSGQFNFNKDVYNVLVYSRQLVDWLDSIGCCVKSTKDLGDSPAKFKVIPDCILQSSAKVWKDFLAVYAECDGTYVKDYTITWLSASPVIIHQLHCMLMALGYQVLKRETSVSISHEDSVNFVKDVIFIGQKKFNHKANSVKYSKLFGLPLSHWKSVLNEAKVKFDRHGCYYLTKDRHVICHSRNSNNFGFGHDTIRLNYDRYKEGQYNEFLNLIKMIDKDEYNKLVFALKQRYFITPIVSISDNGKQKVYDLAMENDPSFIANGIVVHNSYASSESAYSTFVETVESYREHLTNKIFYSKLFPLIAVINDLYVNPQGAQADSNISGFLSDLSNKQNLKIPKLHWHKELEAHEDESQFEVLQTLSDMGVPIALKTWIAASGFDSQALLRDLADDKALKEKFDKYKASPEPNEEDAEIYSAFAGVKDPRTGKNYQEGVPPRLTSSSLNKGPSYSKRLSSRLVNMEPSDTYTVDTKGRRHPSLHPNIDKRKEDEMILAIARKMKADLNYRHQIKARNKKLGKQKLPGFL